MANEGKVERIELKVSNALLPYIQTKPIHGSQKVKAKEEDYTVVTLDLIPNYELESLIHSYGEKVELVKPAALRRKINARVDKIYINYKK